MFAVKGGRYITHMKKLGDVEQALANFLASGVLALGPKLGPILWQLPPEPGLPRGSDGEVLRRAAGHHASGPRSDRGAAATTGSRPSSGRNRSIAPERRQRRAAARGGGAARLLRHRGLRRNCAASTESPWWSRTPPVGSPGWTRSPAELVYVRLHGDQELYSSGYSDQGIEWWAARVQGWADTEGVREVQVYFDNDGHAHAPFDARRLAERLGRYRAAANRCRRGDRCRRCAAGSAPDRRAGAVTRAPQTGADHTCRSPRPMAGDL